jgi:prophage DNA circulation protein
MQGTSRSELAAELERCARLCEETAAVHVERYGDVVRTDLVSGLLLAAAAMDTAAHVVDERSPSAGTALLIVQTLVADAIGAAERRGLDESLLHCVAALRRLERELRA